MAQFFYQNFTAPASPTPAFPLIIPIGFTPARVDIIDLTQLATPTGTNGYRAQWWNGMTNGYAMTTIFKVTTLADTTTLATSNGITILNQLGSSSGQYGAIVSAFTNANPGVLTVDSTFAANITAGCVIRVSALADDQSGSTLNGNYYVASVTGTTITLGTPPAGFVFNNANYSTISSANTSALSVYVSGGFVTVLQTAQASIPNPPYNVNSDVPSWYNEASYAISIGSNCFANGSAADNFLIQAWDNMVVF